MRLPRLRGRLKGKRHIVLGAVLGAGVAFLATYGYSLANRQAGAVAPPTLTDIAVPVVGGLALGAVGAKMVPAWAWAMGILGGMAGPWMTQRVSGVVSGVA